MPYGTITKAQGLLASQLEALEKAGDVFGCDGGPGSYGLQKFDMMVDTPHVRKFMRFLGACFFFDDWFGQHTLVFYWEWCFVRVRLGYHWLVVWHTNGVATPTFMWAEDRHILRMFWMGWNDQADELWVLSIAVNSGFLYAHTFVYVYGLYRCIYHRISIYSWTVLVVYFFVQRSEFPWDSTVYIRIYTYDIYIYMHIYIPCVCILYVYVVISTGISWYKNPQPGLGIVSRINRRAPVKVDHVVAGCLCLARHLDTESRMDARAPVKVDQVVTSSSAWTWGVMEMKLTLVGGAIVMTLLLPNWGKENGLMLLERAMNCLTGKLGGWNSMKGFLHVARVISATRALYSTLLYISLHVFLCSRAMGMGTVWFEQELCASWGLVFLFLLFWGQAGEQVQHFVVYQRTVGVTTSYQSTTQQLLVVAQLALVGDAILLVIHTMWTDFLLALPRETYNINLLWYIIYIYLCRNTQPHIRLPSPSLTLCSSFAKRQIFGIPLELSWTLPLKNASWTSRSEEPRSHRPCASLGWVASSSSVVQKGHVQVCLGLASLFGVEHYMFFSLTLNKSID